MMKELFHTGWSGIFFLIKWHLHEMREVAWRNAFKAEESASAKFLRSGCACVFRGFK